MKLYVWDPKKPGIDRFSVMAEEEHEARADVESYIRERAWKYQNCESPFPESYYDVEVYAEGAVVSYERA